MCVNLVKSVLKSNIDTTPKMILVVICEAADKYGSCYPSNKEVARRASVHLNTAKAWMRKFREIGLIKRVQRERENGSCTSATTQINVPLLETLTNEKLCGKKAKKQQEKTSLKGNANVPPVQQDTLGSTDVPPVQQEYPHPSTAVVPPRGVQQEYPLYEQSELTVRKEQSEKNSQKITRKKKNQTKI